MGQLSDLGAVDEAGTGRDDDGGVKVPVSYKKSEETGALYKPQRQQENNGTQRKINRVYRELIDRVNWIAGVGRTSEMQLRGVSPEAAAVAAELKHYVPIVQKMTAQAESRV